MTDYKSFWRCIYCGEYLCFQTEPKLVLKCLKCEEDHELCYYCANFLLDSGFVSMVGPEGTGLRECPTPELRAMLALMVEKKPPSKKTDGIDF